MKFSLSTSLSFIQRRLRSAPARAGLAIVLCAPLASLAGGVPEGAYLRSEFTGGQLRNDIYVFQNGQVAYPATGPLEKYNFVGHKQRAPKYVGLYAVSGSTLKIDWPDGSKWEGTLKPDKAGGFDYRSAAYAPIKPLPKGAVLEGKFRGGASTSGAFVGFDYEFRADGTYTSTTAGNVSSKSLRSAASASSASSAQGRYSVNGSTLTLTPSGATVKTHLIYYVPTKAGDKKPDMIIIDGVVATRG